ncbi:MAG: hypothetical protein ACJ788_11495 [Ktedonobacteraceae bacterium]
MAATEAVEPRQAHQRRWRELCGTMLIVAYRLLRTQESYDPTEVNKSLGRKLVFAHRSLVSQLVATQQSEWHHVPEYAL